MTATFTWTPDFGGKMDRQPRLRVAQFGEGYQQRAQDGLNADLRKYTLTFGKRATAEATAILSFLETQGGVLSFYYTHIAPTDNVQRIYVCKSWGCADAGYGVSDITATFEQVPM